MNRVEAGERLTSSLEWVCQTLWLGQRQEPELLQLQEARGSLGYPHYIVSRAGQVPEADWAEVLYVLPPALVEHLLPRCRALEPLAYQEASLEAAGAALRRLRPGAEAAVLVRLAGNAEPARESVLARAWWQLDPGPDPHRQLLWAAMTIREARAYAHYRAAAAEGLAPVELLLITSLWERETAVPFQRLYRWGDEEVEAARGRLREDGWLADDGTLSPAGEERRDAIEARSEAHTDHLLATLSDSELTELIAGLPEPG